MFIRMKNRVFRFVLLLAAVSASWTVSAEPQQLIAASVKQIVAEFKGTKGVNCMVIQKGQGLGLVKAILKPKLGAEFLDGVTSIIIIEHSKASSEVCESLQNRLNAYSETLRDFQFNNNEFGGGESVRGYVAIDESMTVASDLIMFVEDKGAKLLIYMGGVLKVEKLDLSPKSN